MHIYTTHRDDKLIHIRYSKLTCMYNAVMVCSRATQPAQ